MTASLANFAKSNPDCNFSIIQVELRNLMIEIAEADGHLDEREEMAIERIEASMREQKTMLNSVKQKVATTKSSLSFVSDSLGKNAIKTVSRSGSSIRNLSRKLSLKGLVGKDPKE
jgi:uncharacterized membrane protein YebE (DUF533 family)